MTILGQYMHASANLGSRTDILEAIGRAFRNGPSGQSLVVFALGTAAVITLITFIMRLSSHHSKPAIEKEIDVLAALLDLLGLDSTEREDLQFVIAHRGDGCDPASLLLSPGNFAVGVNRACTNAEDESRRSRLDKLCAKLFDEPAPDCAASAAQTDAKPSAGAS